MRVAGACAARATPKTTEKTVCSVLRVSKERRRFARPQAMGTATSGAATIATTPDRPETCA